MAQKLWLSWPNCPGIPPTWSSHFCLAQSTNTRPTTFFFSKPTVFEFHFLIASHHTCKISLKWVICRISHQHFLPITSSKYMFNNFLHLYCIYRIMYMYYIYFSDLINIFSRYCNLKMKSNRRIQNCDKNNEQKQFNCLHQFISRDQPYIMSARSKFTFM